MQQLLIIGGGFAGVWGALGASAERARLRRTAADLRITLITREPYLTIRPRLYEPNPEGLRVPLGDLFDSLGVDLVLGDVTRVDAAARTVAVDAIRGRTILSYDRLILAAGSRLRRPDIPGAYEHAFSVDMYDEAMSLDRHLAGLGMSPSGRAGGGRFTAVVIGAGFAGLEVATTLVSRLRALAARASTDEQPAVVLVERAPLVAPDLGPNPRPLVAAALRELGVAVRVGTSVAEIDGGHVTLTSGERIAAATAVWTAGLYASDLTLQLPAERDGVGRAVVDEHLRVRGVDGVFAAGDVAHALADSEHVAPMSCQYAIPMGERAGRNAVAELSGREPNGFLQPDYVTCLDLGEWGAIFTQGWDRQVHLTGFWGKVMKETINTRMIYPPPAGRPASRTTITSDRLVRPAA
jgi:NADH:ubiquinone reductase (H+-translocating)